MTQAGPFEYVYYSIKYSEVSDDVSLSSCPPGRVWHEVSDFHLSQLICSWACLTWGIWRCLSLNSGLLWLEISVVVYISPSSVVPGRVWHEVSDASLSAPCPSWPFLTWGIWRYFYLSYNYVPDRAWHEVFDVVSISTICVLIVSDMRYLTLFLSQLHASWPCLTWGIWRCFCFSSMLLGLVWHEVSDVSISAICFLALSDMRYLTFPSQLYDSWPCLTWGIWRCFCLSYMLAGRAWHEVSDVVSLSAPFSSWPCLTWGIWRCFYLSYMLLDRASDVVSLSAPFSSWPCLTWGIWRCLSLSSLAVSDLKSQERRRYQRIHFEGADSVRVC